jgi:hypoxanthine phosphoribosyltransferase
MKRESDRADISVLISEVDLQERIRQLAEEIDRDYQDLSPLLCVGILKGSIFFMVDLLKKLQTPLEIDFLQTSSYRSGTTPGEVRIRKDVDVSIQGKHVLLIEDIVDTGYTVNTILELLRFRGAKSVRLCSLLDKVAARKIPIPIDYRGFTIEDVFVIGYGLDLDERYRELPFIGIWEGTLDDDATHGKAPS